MQRPGGFVPPTTRTSCACSRVSCPSRPLLRATSCANCCVSALLLAVRLAASASLTARQVVSCAFRAAISESLCSSCCACDSLCCCSSDNWSSSSWICCRTSPAQRRVACGWFQTSLARSAEPLCMCQSIGNIHVVLGMPCCLLQWPEIGFLQGDDTLPCWGTVGTCCWGEELLCSIRTFPPLVAISSTSPSASLSFDICMGGLPSS